MIKFKCEIEIYLFWWRFLFGDKSLIKFKKNTKQGQINI
jgi:hypothetical protein